MNIKSDTNFAGVDFSRWLVQRPRRPLVMGILNVTPDSFSDGGEFLAPEAACDQALGMLADGADLIDIGGESTKPGSTRVSVADQLARIAPVLTAIRAQTNAVISIDTTQSEVAERSLDLGATLINDISAGRDDPRMLPLVARREVPIVLMHMQGTPATMQVNPTYVDVTNEVIAFLKDRASAALEAGVRSDNILIDPGIGFGKTVAHNLQLLRELNRFTDLPYPLLLGTSRKGFIGKVLDQPNPADRLWGTAATIAWGVTNGAAIVRVHDVRPIAQIVKMICSIQTGGIS